ncbi:MAG: HD domain-containing protein [Planctomycetes bacterium]|nr:HD domain-containing protein [Planctomycetota bacterium]
MSSRSLHGDDSTRSDPVLAHAPSRRGGRGSGNRKQVTELAAQAQVEQVFLATRKQLRPNRNGQLYLQVELADRSGSITGRMWNASDEDFSAFDEGDYVRVEGAVQLYTGALQIIVTAIGRVDPKTIEEAEFRVLSTADVERLLVEMTALLSTLRSQALRDLVDEVLADKDLMQSFARSPAGVKQHHAYAGGLLAHVVNLLRLADRVAPLYPEVNRDLLLVGVLVHDIGKTLELESERGFSYTDVGQLLGHVLLGLELVDEKIRAVEDRTGIAFDTETAVRVKHMIASHHGEYAFGAPKLPMTLEAIALHQLDQLDARMAGTLQLMQNEAALDGGWTQYHPNLGRKFFKGRG